MMPGCLHSLEGDVGIHYPSTITYADGKYYVYGTGGGALVSDDGWTWRRGTRPGRTGLAPDVIHIGDRYYMYVARNMGAQPKPEVDMIWSKSLDPTSPDYKWNEGGVVASSDGWLLDLGNGIQKFSMHWEADLDPGGASVLDIRPLLWKDGWPVAGENAKEGTYQIQFVHTGTSLEMAVQGMPVGGPRDMRRPGGAPAGGPRPGAAAGFAAVLPGNSTAPAGGPPAGFGGGMFAGTGTPIPDQTPAQVQSNWPSGDAGVAMDNYELQAHAEVADHTCTRCGGLSGVTVFQNHNSWHVPCAGGNRRPRIDYRPVVYGRTGAALATGRARGWKLAHHAEIHSELPRTDGLVGGGASFPTLSKFDRNSDKQHWLL